LAVRAQAKAKISAAANANGVAVPRSYDQRDA
jgi:hypothetical protein